MCGISGIINFDGLSPNLSLVTEMTRLLAHRGPDAEGVLQLKGAVLGHRRLSILDLSGGAQPMKSASGKLAIVFNGEIFNYLEIRRELEIQGARFRTTSDTEVLLELFEREGPAGVSKLNGQFAFAIYNETEQKLFLGRDRLGEKPLFYYHMGKDLAFGSEVKVLAHFLRNTGRKLSVCEDAFFNFLSLNYVPFERSMLEGVYAVKPGEVLEFSAQRTKTHAYWLIENKSDNQSFEELALEAARIRLRSDVPVGLFLSGGLDSSTIAKLVSKLGVKPKAFIADIDEAGFSEAQNALEVAKVLGLDTHVIKVSPDIEDLPALVEKLVWHGDSALADSGSVPLYLLARETAKEVKVVLSGDGGDELFAGYLPQQATLLARRIPWPLRQILTRFTLLTRLLPQSSAKVSFAEKAERFLHGLRLAPGAAHFAWNGMFFDSAKRKLINQDLLSRSSTGDTFYRLAREFGLPLRKPTLQDILRADQSTYLRDDILVKGDRMTMAHGLELRPVFLDHRIVEFARRLTAAELIDQQGGKKILRDYLTAAGLGFVTERKKQGFSIPVHRWMRTSLKEFAGDLFCSKLAAESGLYEPKELKRLWDQHLAGRRLGFELWGVMVSLVWYQQLFLGSSFLSGSPIVSLPEGTAAKLLAESREE